MKPKTILGQTLLDLILEEYGTRKAFAKAAFLSEPELSGIISGKRALTPKTLQDRLMPAFPKLHHQQALRDAYVATFLPAPAIEQAPQSNATDSEIERYLASTYWLSQGSHTLDVFLTTRDLWYGLRQSGRHGLALRAAHAFVSSTFALDRKPEGLLVAREMRQLAIAEHEPSLVARSLWLEATAMPASAPTERTTTLYHDFARYVEHWKPLGSDRPIREELAHMSLRDSVVFATRSAAARKVNSQTLEGTLRAFQPVLENVEDPELYSIGKVVETEALLALGDVAEAEEALESVRSIKTPNHPRQNWKFSAVEAHVLFAAGQRDRAWRLAVQALDIADQMGYIHGHNTLSSLTSQIAQ